jgi:hypothetical protein
MTAKTNTIKSKSVQQQKQISATAKADHCNGENSKSKSLQQPTTAKAIAEALSALFTFERRSFL